MIISHDYKFIFIAIPKTGTTSIENALRPYGVTAGEHWANKHMRARVVRRVVGERIWNEYTTCAFVRNPYEWLVSWYEYRCRDELLDPAHERRSAYAGNMTFEEWIMSDPPYTPRSQVPYVTDMHGECIVDFIGRFESLEDDFARMCDLIDLPQIELPHQNAFRRHPYQCYYTPGARAYVQRNYSTDLIRFGYSFDEACEAGERFSSSPKESSAARLLTDLSDRVRRFL